MASSLFSYDLFLSYNSADHRIVEEVAHKLAEAGFKELFLDRWNLPIGTRWRPMLEKALGSIKAVAVLRLYSSHVREKVRMVARIWSLLQRARNRFA